MFESIIYVICFYNGKMLMKKIDVKYVEEKTIIVSLDAFVSSTFEQLLSMIYLRTDIDKKTFSISLQL